MPIGSSITDPIPPVGTAGTGYASQLVAFLQAIKALLESKVPLTSLLAGLFDLANNGIANASYIGLYEQTAAPSTPVGSLQRYGGELYYVSPSGAVRITNAGGLDVVAAGGISGDYAAPAEFRYDLLALEYYAYSNYAAGEWARVGAQGFDIYGTLTGTTRVRLAWAGGANPSYTLTLPAAVPTETTQVRMSSTGDLTVGRQTLSKTVSTATWRSVTTSSGAIDSGFLFVTGNGFPAIGGGAYWSTPTTSGLARVLVAAVELDEGDVITSFDLYIKKNSSAATTVSGRLYSVSTTGVATQLGVVTESGNATGDLTKSSSAFSETVGSGKSYLFVVDVSDTATAADRIYGLKINYTSAH